jgi:uncharacterized protein (TIGR00369 family)
MSTKDHHPTSKPIAPIDADTAAAREAFATPAATGSSDPWREPVRGGVAYPALAALPGVEQVRAFLEGRAPAPPVARLTGRRIIDASFGSATYTLPATDWMLGAKGVVHSGVLALLADGALFAAVVSALPARVACTTAELSMTFFGSPPSAGGDLTARGRVLHIDNATALAEVHVHDRRDRLVAHGTSRCSVFAPFDESIQLLAPREFAAADSNPSTPDPHLRVPPALSGDRLDQPRDGLELLRAELRGELPPPPIDQLTGMRLVGAEHGRVGFTLPASPWLRNEWGTVYGGVLSLLAKSAAAAAVQSTADRGTGFTALDIKANFLRAVPADGRELQATGTVLHRGKRLAIATAEVLHGEDRVAVLTGTTALIPPARLRPTHRTNNHGVRTRGPAAGTGASIATSPTTLPAAA